MRTRTVIGSCALATIFLAPASLHGLSQVQVRSISAEPSCVDCRVVLDTVAMVGAITDSVLIANPGGVVVTSHDTVVVGGSFRGDPNLVFAPDGRLVRTIGRSGQGPGELWAQSGLAIISDSLLLVPQAARLSVMDMAGRVLATAPLQAKSPGRLYVNADGRILDSFAGSSPSSAGLRFRLISPDLRVIRSFGEIGVDEQRRCSQCRSRPSTWSERFPGSFWSIAPNRFEIQRWSATGELLDVLRVDGAEWFDEWDADPPSSDVVVQEYSSDPPREELRSIQEDASGLIWITAWVLREDWRPFPGGVPRLRRPPLDPDLVEYLRNQWDQIMVVIDPERGETLATWRVRARRLFALGDGRMLPRGSVGFYERSEDDLGVRTLTITRARLGGSLDR